MVTPYHVAEFILSLFGHIDHHEDLAALNGILEVLDLGVWDRNSEHARRPRAKPCTCYGQCQDGAAAENESSWWDGDGNQASNGPGCATNGNAALNRRYQVGFLQKTRLWQVFQGHVATRDQMDIALFDALEQQILNNAAGAIEVGQQEIQTFHVQCPLGSRCLKLELLDYGGTNIISHAQPADKARKRF